MGRMGRIGPIGLIGPMGLIVSRAVGRRRGIERIEVSIISGQGAM